MDFNRLNQIASYNDVANILILDTTDLTLNEVAEKIANWIKNLTHSSVHSGVNFD